MSPWSSSPEARARLERAWPALRALLIALVVLGAWVDSLPLPELREGDLRYSVARDELRRWRRALGAVGIDMTEEEIADAGLEVGEAAIALRKATMAPMRPFTRVTGTGQSWGLFAYPNPYPGRLVVSGKGEDGKWIVLYRAPGPGRDLLGKRLRYRRVRGIYDETGDRPKPGATYRRFVDWVAAEILADRPDLEAVEVRLDLVTVRLPGEAAAPPDKRRHARLRDRGDLR